MTNVEAKLEPLVLIWHSSFGHSFVFRHSSFVIRTCHLSLVICFRGFLRIDQTVRVSIEIDHTRMRPNDVPVVVGDFSRLNAATGWRPEVTFDRMLDDLLSYWRGQA